MHELAKGATVKTSSVNVQRYRETRKATLVGALVNLLLLQFLNLSLKILFYFPFLI